MMVLVGIVGGLTLALLLLLRVLWRHPAPPTIPGQDWPAVSILIPARNEAAHIARCLQAALACDYPADCLEIVVADDDSTDDTYALARGYADRYAQVRVIRVGPPLGQARAKANALAYLARAARHDIWLCTDADITPNPHWIKMMVSSHLRERAHVVAGVTCVVDQPAPGVQVQRADWLLAWGMIQVAVEQGQPVSSAGNNMLVTRQAYEAVGGFPAIPFSVTEDYALYHAIIKAGFRTHHQFSPLSKVFTQPAPLGCALLQQRKRWMKGAVSLPPWMVALLALQALFYPVMLAGALLCPALALPLWLLKALVQASFIGQVGRRVGEAVKPIYLATFEIYSAFLSSLLLLYYLWPGPVVWKDRKL